MKQKTKLVQKKAHITKEHSLFSNFFKAFNEKKSDQANDLLELVEAFYKPKLHEVRHQITILEQQENQPHSSEHVEKLKQEL